MVSIDIESAKRNVLRSAPYSEETLDKCSLSPKDRKGGMEVDKDAKRQQGEVFRELPQ